MYGGVLVEFLTTYEKPMETSFHSQDSMNEWAGSSNDFMKKFAVAIFPFKLKSLNHPPRHL